MALKKNPVISILGCGWLGLPLATYLVEKKYTVRGSTTSKEKLALIESSGIIPALLKVTENIEGDVDAFFDCDMLIINIPPGRRHLKVETDHPKQIESILKHAEAKEVRQIIFVSSTGVYKNTHQIINEEGVLEPSRSSGKALVRAEQFIQSYKYNYTILRMAGLAGGERQPGKWFAGKSDIPFGDTPVNMVHRDDCISAIEKVIERSTLSAIYNICADLHPVKKRFYNMQCAKLNLEAPHFLDGVGPHKVIDNRKFKVEYDFKYGHPDPCLF